MMIITISSPTITANTMTMVIAEFEARASVTCGTVSTSVLVIRKRHQYCRDNLLLGTTDMILMYPIQKGDGALC